jgi:hypothetical protein
MRDFEAEFAAVWAIYPKRPGNPRHAAMVEFVKLGKRGSLPPLDELIRAIRSYAAYCAREQLRPSLIAHTRTWLYQHRWADWLTPVENRSATDFTNLPPILERFAKTIGAQAWNNIFSDCTISASDSHIVIRPRSQFMAEKIESGYGSTIERFTDRSVVVERFVGEVGGIPAS